MLNNFKITVAVLLLFVAFSLKAQLPENIQLIGELEIVNAAKTILVCNEAGTIANRDFLGNNQSNDIRYLCFNDSMMVTHNGDFNLSGDPNILTNPGIGYAIYYCNPTIDGMDLASIVLDPCRVRNPTPANDLWIVTDQANGDALFNNILFQPANITVMDFYNNGNPVELIYAPITVDDFNNNTYESDAGSPAGPCVDVNIDEAFTVVYLNEISVEIKDDQVNCDCSGDFQISIDGGLPEFDLVSSYTVTVRNMATGEFALDGQVVNFLTDFSFSIPRAGDYEIIVEDGVSCEYRNLSTICGADRMEIVIGDITGQPGDNVCVPVVVNCLDNVASFQFSMTFDESIISFTGINSTLIADGTINTFNLSPGVVTNTWTEPGLGGIPLVGNDTLLYLCFDIIGSPGECSEVDINDSATDLLFVYFDNLGGVVGIRNDAINVEPGNVCVFFDGLIVSDTIIQHVLSCFSDLTGFIRIDVDGGIEPYTFEWDTPTGILNTEDIFNLGVGTYTLTITDSAVPATQVIEIYEIKAPNRMMITPSVVQPTCFGDVDGCLVLENITGGEPPYSWRWIDDLGNPVGTPNQDMVCGFGVGNYRLRVIDSNGCIDSTNTVELTSTALGVRLDRANSVEMASCNPGSDGQLQLIISGGDISTSGAYSITWSNAETNTEVIRNLDVGTYSVTIVDDRGCESIRDNMTIAPPQAPSVSTFRLTPISCPGERNGSIIAIIESPLSPIESILWSNNASSDTIRNLSAGWYYITITAADGCQGIDSVELLNPEGVGISSIDRINPSCFSYTDGSIGLILDRNIDNLNVLWSNGDTGLNITNLAAGTYSAIFIDTIANCNLDTVEVSLFDPAGMIIDINGVINASCFDQALPSDCDGRAILNVTGGNAPLNQYDISWSNTQVNGNTNSSTNVRLCAGVNYVTVTDEVGCELIDSVLIGSPLEIVLNQMNIEKTRPSCKGFDDGEIRLAIEGGVSPYMVTWEDNSNGLIRTDLTEGNYEVIIEDFNGCISGLGPIQLEDPDTFYVFVDIDSSSLSINCAGDTDGLIQVTQVPADSISPLVRYQWSPNVSNSFIAENLLPGTYSVTATNTNGCVDSALAIISSVPMIDFDIPATSVPTCFGQQTAFVVDFAAGGNGAPYTYKILEEGIELNIGDTFPLFAGDYTISIVDRNGCTLDTVIIIAQPNPLLVNIPHDTILRGRELILAELGENRKYSYQYTPSNLLVDSVIWEFEDNVGFRYLNPDSTIISAKLERSQLLKVTIFDENGCRAIDEIFIKVDRDRNVFIPNAFSPDADNNNDIFAVYSGTGVVNIASFRIFDRWGAMIYGVNDVVPALFNSNAIGWAGTHNGKELNPGVFIYLIQVEFEDGLSLLYRGDVTLVK